MKIAINVQSLLPSGLEGFGHFAYQTVKRMVKQHPEHEFILLFSKGIHPEFKGVPNVKCINIFPPINRPQVFYYKFEWVIPYLLKKHHVDLFVSTDGTSSSRLKNIKQLPVFHDLSFEENPEWSPKSFVNYYKKYFPKYSRLASRIATVSEYSKMDIHKRYGVPLDKIDVIYSAPNGDYQSISEEMKVATRKNYSNGNPYFVFVGSLNPRKNVARLFEAFHQFKQTDSNNTKLIIVGNRFFWNEEIEKAYQSISQPKDVIFTGYVPSDELRNIIASSIAMTYISLFEGFGVPPLEAMQCETAVITSNVTCIPEISGEAALYVNPTSITEIVNAMKTLSNDKNLRESLIEKGKIQHQKYSWDKTATLFWNSIEKALK